MQSWMRTPVLFAPLIIPICTLVGCGTETSADPLEVSVEAAPESAWRSTGLPYGGFEAEGDRLRLSYDGQSVSLPTTDPAWTKAVDGEPGAEEPRLELSTAGATMDAGIFQIATPGELAQVWELTSEGRWQQIGSELTKIALADPTGHLAAWVEGAGPDAEKEKGAKVVVYDTEAHETLALLDASELPDEYIWVTVVDGDTVVLQAVGDSDGSPWARSYAWRPRSEALEELRSTRPEEGITVTDVDVETGQQVLLSFKEESRLLGPAGEVTIGDFGFGQFSPDGSQVVLQGFGLAKVLDTKSSEPIKLDLPIGDQDSFVPGSFAWTTDGRLAVIGSLGEDVQHAWLCSTDTSRCEDLGADYLLSASRENSAMGQFIYGDEQEGD